MGGPALYIALPQEKKRVIDHSSRLHGAAIYQHLPHKWPTNINLPETWVANMGIFLEVTYGGFLK